MVSLPGHTADREGQFSPAAWKFMSLVQEKTRIQNLKYVFYWLKTLSYNCKRNKTVFKSQESSGGQEKEKEEQMLSQMFRVSWRWWAQNGVKSKPGWQGSSAHGWEKELHAHVWNRWEKHGQKGWGQGLAGKQLARTWFWGFICGRA